MSEQEPQDRFENQQVTVQYKKKPGCLIKMEVIVHKEAAQAAYAKALKEVKKEVSIPGFRRGKAPEEVVEKRFADSLDSHFRHLISELAFKEGVSLIHRHPFTQKSVRKIDVKSIDKLKGAHILFEFEAAPDVPKVDPQALDIQPVTLKEPTEEDLAASRFNLRLLHAEKQPLERAVEMGDFALITLKDPSHPEELLYDKKELYIDTKYAPKWIVDTAVGMKKGETKEVTPPQDDKQVEPSTPMSLTIDEVLSCNLPEENDEFAVKVHAKDKEDLLDKLRSRLKYEAEFAAFEKMRHALRNELFRLYAFDLPQSLIEGETEGRFRPFLEAAKKTHSEETLDIEKIKKSFNDEVKRYFTLLFLLQPLTKEVKGEVHQPELLEELTHQIMHAPFESRYIYPGLAEQETHQRLLMALILRKCEDWCIEQKVHISAPKRT